MCSIIRSARENARDPHTDANGYIEWYQLVKEYDKNKRSAETATTPTSTNIEHTSNPLRTSDLSALRPIVIP